MTNQYKDKVMPLLDSRLVYIVKYSSVLIRGLLISSITNHYVSRLYSHFENDYQPLNNNISLTINTNNCMR